MTNPANGAAAPKTHNPCLWAKRGARNGDRGSRGASCGRTVELYSSQRVNLRPHTVCSSTLAVRASSPVTQRCPHLAPADELIGVRVLHQRPQLCQEGRDVRVVFHVANSNRHTLTDNTQRLLWSGLQGCSWNNSSSSSCYFLFPTICFLLHPTSFCFLVMGFSFFLF